MLTTLLFKHASEKKRILFVFDNVDHYADLELGKMTGSLDRFIEVFLGEEIKFKDMFYL